jgi:hypothetical protein
VLPNIAGDDDDDNYGGEKARGGLGDVQILVERRSEAL